MSRAAKIVLGTAAAFVAAALIVQNVRHQWETEQRLTDLQKQIAQNASKPIGAVAAPVVSPAPPPAASTAAPGVVPVVVPEGSGPGGYVEKQANILKIMNVGWGLIDKRSPEPAKIAVQVFQDGLKNVDETSPDLYNGLGRALLIAGRPREAIAAWRKGLMYAPKFADMQSGIGWAYWHLGDPYDAKKAWEAAVAIDGKCVDAWSALAWIDMAMGNKERSVQGFRALVDYDNKRVQWTTGLAMARAGNRRLDQINSQFPLPPLEAFDHAPVEDPAAMSSATTSTAPTS